jgi:hypothetical protein
MSQFSLQLSAKLLGAIAMVAMFGSVANAQSSGPCQSCGTTPSYAPTQYAPTQYASAQYAPAQYAPAQYAPAQYAPGQSYAPCQSCQSGTPIQSAQQPPCISPIYRAPVGEYSPMWHEDDFRARRGRYRPLARQQNRGVYYWGNYRPGNSVPGSTNFGPPPFRY